VALLVRRSPDHYRFALATDVRSAALLIRKRVASRCASYAAVV
jgi:hypothetical protein